jgi:hypothetical protein
VHRKSVGGTGPRAATPGLVSPVWSACVMKHDCDGGLPDVVTKRNSSPVRLVGLDRDTGRINLLPYKPDAICLAKSLTFQARCFSKHVRLIRGTF